ncbi:unnamed protein product [Withania somnifera]
MASENWPACNNIISDDTDLLNQMEIPDFDSTILMSFLDESQMEYCDDEKLKSLIQSLEAELEYPISIINNPAATPNYLGSEDNSSEELVDIDDFSWMDMEMSSSTSPSDNYSMIEFQVGSDNYSQFLTCIPIEEQVYDSLWLQTDLSVVDNISQ